MSSRPKREFCCDFGNCTNKYRTKYSLKRHYLSHMGVKQHQCPYCEKRFSLTQYLQEHIYIHTGEMPFVCNHPGCGKRFRQAGKLSIHKKIHTTCSSKEENGSQGSTKLSEVGSQAKIAQEFLGLLNKFTLPDFIMSRDLPLPPQLLKLEESNDI